MSHDSRQFTLKPAPRPAAPASRASKPAARPAVTPQALARAYAAHQVEIAALAALVAVATGQPARPSTAATAPAIAEYDRLVAGFVAQGMKKTEAIGAVMRKNPGAVAAYNAARAAQLRK